MKGLRLVVARGRTDGGCVGGLAGSSYAASDFVKVLFDCLRSYSSEY